MVGICPLCMNGAVFSRLRSDGVFTAPVKVLPVRVNWSSAQRCSTSSLYIPRQLNSFLSTSRTPATRALSGTSPGKLMTPVL